MGVHLEVLPVVQTRPLQASVGDLEPQWADQMQGGLSGQAQTADGAGVRGDFGFNQNDVKMMRHELSGSALGANSVEPSLQLAKTAVANHT